MATEIIKSKYDKRKYKIITLKNKLEIMLISDTDANKSAISMNVGVGCFQDPVNIPGLAHFLEHMLFMGTKKYPNENDFSDYLSRNGGMSNAFTSPDTTNYHLHVNVDGFKGALDRFAHFFIDPLLNKNSIDKEMNAINSEHSKNLQNDMRRIISLLRVLSKDNHLAHKFCTGNLETLRDVPKKKKINIYNEVLKFYKKWYSANIMKLVILDKRSLSEMEKMIKIFENVKNKNVVINKNNIDPYKNDPVRIISNPVGDSDKLEIFWSINGYEKEYFRSTLYFVCEILDYRGNNSFLSVLKNMGYVYNFNFGYMNYNNMSYYLAYMSINLTKKGLKNVDKVLNMTYQFINYVNQLDESVFKNRFKDLNNIASLNFMFKQKEEPLDYVMDIAQNMEIYPTKYYLSGDVLMRKFKFSLIKDILNNMASQQAIHMILSKDMFIKKGKNRKIEKEYYYGTEYFTYPDKKFPINIPKIISQNIKFPQKNEFIPNNFSIKKIENKNKYPINIKSNKFAEIWHKRDTKFKKPFTYLYIELVNQIAHKSPKNNVLNSLLTNIWNDVLTEKLNPAFTVGHYVSMSSGFKGLTINLSGYSDKFNNLVKKTLNETINRKIEQNKFNIKKQSLEKFYKNLKYKSPLNQAYTNTYNILIDNIIYDDDKKREIKNITYNDLLNYKIKLFSNMYMKFMFYGNISKSETRNITKFITNIINPKKIAQYPKYKIIKLTDQRFVYSKKSTNENDNDSVVVSMYQFGKLNHKLYLLVEILQNMIGEPFFDQLRTKEQLGYIVGTRIIYLEKTVNLAFEIQSSVKGPNYLLERIDHFLKNFRTTLGKMKESQFNSYIKIINEKKKMKYINMDEEFNFNCSEIKMDEYMFNRKTVDINTLKKIKKIHIIKLYDKFITKHKYNLVVKIIGKSGNTEKCSINKKNIQIKSFAEFKSNSQTFL